MIESCANVKSIFFSYLKCLIFYNKTKVLEMLTHQKAQPGEKTDIYLPCLRLFPNEPFSTCICTRWEYLHFLFALAPGGKEAAASGFQMLLALLGTTQPAMRGKPQALSFLISFKELICICIFLFAFADAISTIGIHPTSNEEKALFNVSFVSKNLSFKLLFSSKSLWVFFCQNFAYNARSVI